jgi:predicted phage tail protein
MRRCTRWFATASARERVRSVRPQIEALEDRHLLAITLPAPRLIEPNGIAPLVPTLNWQGVFGAHHYDVWLQHRSTQHVLRDIHVNATAWTVTSSLVDGESYRWWVRALDGFGNTSLWSAPLDFVASDLEAPTLIGPSVSASLQPTFNWNVVAGAHHYDIWVQDRSTQQVWRDTNVPGTTWAPSNPLTPGNSYRWWVRAIDAGGDAGPWSAFLDFGVSELTPPTLIGPSGSAIPLPTFGWNAVASAAAYDIWIRNLDTGQLLQRANVTSTTWTPDGPLDQGHAYRWWVRAVGVDGLRGPWSSPLDFSIAVLPAPSLVGPTGTSSPLPTFSWNAVADATSYDIWVQDQQTGQVLRDSAVVGTTWVPNELLRQGHDYRWWVRAIDAHGRPGLWSASLDVTVAALAAPSLIGPSVWGSALPTFTWNSVTGAHHYDIWVHNRITGEVTRDLNAVTTTWIPSSPLRQGDDYRWWVRAVDSIGSPGPWSSFLDFMVSDLAPPSLIAPAGSVSPQPTFSWNAVAGADHYDIWVENRHTHHVLRDRTVNATTWTAPSLLIQSADYRWWVRAVDGAGDVGPWSTYLDFQVAALAVPTLIGPGGSASTLPTFGWNAVTGADHYDIWLENRNSGEVLRDVNVLTTTWDAGTPLRSGDNYRWWVRAVDALGSPGPWSASLDFKVSDLTPPGLVAPTGSSSPLPTFSWNAVTGAHHYEIWVQDRDGGAHTLRDQNIAGTTWVPPGLLIQGHRYRWSVRAVDAAGSAGPWSEFLDFQVAQLPAPTIIEPEGCASPLPVFRWDPAAGADHYDLWLESRDTGEVLQASVAAATWTPSSPLGRGQRYRWWVRAVDAVGSPGPWSAFQDFTVFILDAPLALAPGGSASTLPTFVWNAVTGADHYGIWLEDRSTGDVLRDQNVVGTSWTPPSPLAAGRTYRWWVQAVDVTGAGGAWSLFLDFVAS